MAPPTKAAKQRQYARSEIKRNIIPSSPSSSIPPCPLPETSPGSSPKRRPQAEIASPAPAPPDLRPASLHNQIPIDGELDDGFFERIRRPGYNERSAAHWDYDSDGSKESDCEFSEGEEEMDPNSTLAQRRDFRDAFEMMCDAARSDPFSKAVFRYQRGSKPHIRTIQRKNKRIREELEDRDNKAIKKIQPSFTPQDASTPVLPPSPPLPPPPPPLPTATKGYKTLEDAIKAIEAKMKQKKQQLHGQNLMRYRAVAAFMNLRANPPVFKSRNVALKVRPLTKLELATIAAKALGRGPYLARKIIAWEKLWRSEGFIPEGRRGCHAKTRSWFNDEGVELAVREFLNSPEAREGKGVTGHKVAQVVGDYLDSQRAEAAINEAFLDIPATLPNRRTRRIKARTARRWLQKLGLRHRIKKTVFIDGHERKDVVKYRQEEFIPKWHGTESRSP